MADITNLLGGFATGMSQGKAQAQQRAMMEDYRKAQTDMIKLEAKKAEAQLKLQEIQAPIYEAISKAVQGQGGGPGMMPLQPPQTLPAGPTTLPNEVPAPTGAANPFDLMSGQGGTFSGTTGLSAKNNNPGNLVYVPGSYQDKYGAVPGQGHGGTPFAAFPDMQSGYNALIDQVKLDQDRGHTVGSFINKYAPPSENNTSAYITNMSNAMGVSPDTPLASIPAPLVAKNIAKFESSTQVGGLPQQIAQGQIPAPMQPPGTRPVPVTPGMGGGITPQKLLEGFLKKNFGVDPDEVKFQKMGSHLWVLDKQGRVMGVYPGQGEYKPVEVTNPDGSKTQVMQLLPPSPLPPGVPVFATPGQAGQAQPAGLGASPPALMSGGLQTAPPVYNFAPVKNAAGGTTMQAVPQPQPGMSYQSEPTKAQTQTAQGFSVSDMGRMNMVLQANNRINDINSMLFPGGKIDRSLIMKALAPMGGIGEGATLTSKMYQAVDSALRLETGAQANEQEIKTKMKQYWPNPQDTDDAIKKKIADLTEYVGGVVKLADPTGEIRKMRGTPTNPAAPASGLPAGAVPLNRTSGGKPVYQLPNGQLWVQ